MKKILSLLAVSLIVFATALSSCKSNADQEKAQTNIANAITGLSLPQTLKNGSTLEECYFENNVLTFVCQIDKKKFKNIDAAQSREKTIEELRTGLLPRNLLNNVVKANASIQYIYTDGKDTISYEILPDELDINK